MDPIVRDATWILEAIENGTAPAGTIFPRLEKVDPVLVYFIFRFLREKYGHGNPAGAGVISRLLELTENYPKLVKLSQSGEKDVIREWFDETNNMQTYYSDPESLIELLVEKIEG